MTKPTDIPMTFDEAVALLIVARTDMVFAERMVAAKGGAVQAGEAMRPIIDQAERIVRERALNCILRRPNQIEYP